MIKMAEDKKKTEKKEQKNEKSMQEIYLEMQMIDQQLKQLQEQAQSFENQVLSVKEVVQNLDDFLKMKPGSKIFVPLQNGIFIEAQLGESKKVKINVGSNTVVEKSIQEAKEMMEKQLNAIEMYRLETSSQIEQLTRKLQELEKEAQK